MNNYNQYVGYQFTFKESAYMMGFSRLISPETPYYYLGMIEDEGVYYYMFSLYLMPLDESVIRLRELMRKNYEMMAGGIGSDSIFGPELLQRNPPIFSLAVLDGDNIFDHTRLQPKKKELKNE